MLRLVGLVLLAIASGSSYHRYRSSIHRRQTRSEEWRTSPCWERVRMVHTTSGSGRGLKRHLRRPRDLPQGRQTLSLIHI